jgi:hypothetical protein
MTQFGSTVAGPHSLTAKFEPTDPNVFAGSTSDPVIVMVQPKQAVVTTTSLAASNTNPASGQQITLTATVTAADGSSPVGSVQFFDGGTALGTPVAVSGGTATRQFSSTVPGQHSLTATFTPTDSNAFTGSTSNPVIVTVQAAALAITTTRLANAKANTAYTATLTATGGTPPYTWAITAGSLPPGISLNASTGVISGTDFTQTGKFSFTVTVTDQAGATASKSLTLSVTGKIK